MKSKLSIDTVFVSAKGKVLLALLTVVLAVSLSWVIIHTVFKETQQAVVKLTTPNKRLALIDNLYYSIHQLNQFQYNEVGSKSKQSITDLSKVFNHIQGQLDSLALYTQDNSSSIAGIDSLKRLIQHHKIVYVRYLKLKTNVVKNNQFKRNIDLLTRLLLANSQKSDTNVVTSSSKTITILESVPVENQSSKTQMGILFDKIFGKKKGKQDPQKTVIEESNTKIDTISRSQQDSIQRVIMKQLSEWTTEQQRRTYQFVNKEKLLLESGNQLLASIYVILSEIKQSEAHAIYTESKQAASTLQHGVFRFNVIMVVFFIIIGVLSLLILFDITRSNTYRKELQIAKDDAEQAAVAKQRFLANMSHEIRNPLQAIIGFTEQSKQHTNTDENIEAIYQSSLHLMQVVNEVLDYSRIASGKVSITHAPFDLFHLITELEQAFKVSGKDKNFVFTVSHNVAPGTYYTGDVFRLKQILYNLLGNAFKFTEKGEVQLQIDIEPGEDGNNQIAFIVTDTGIGMNEQQLEKVFNEFEQGTGDIANHYGGTGLGLTITKELVQAMNGVLDVKSELNKGSVFRVLFQLPESESGEADSIPVVTAGEKLSFEKVWVTDDDAFIRKVCEGIFEKHGIEHRVFSSAAELLATHPEKKMPLFLVDIRMKDMNGVELCKEIRQRSPNAIVVAVTAQALPEEQQYILDSGFDDILTKPFTESDLLRKISRFNEVAYDLTTLRQFSMNDDALVAENIQSFIDETRQDIADLKAYLRQPDKTACYEVLHRVAGRLGLAGAEKLGRTCRILEVELDKADSFEPFTIRINNVIKELNILLFQLQNET